MQREIVFRGTDIRTGKIVNGSLINLILNGVKGSIIVTNPNISGEHLSDPDALCFGKDDISVVYPNSVGQYTGLHDKNGNSVFEGDIVKWDDGSNGKYWRFAVVTVEPDIIFNCEPVKVVNGVKNSSNNAFHFANFIYKDTENHLTVIGNVFDNPEMVEPYNKLHDIDSSDYYSFIHHTPIETPLEEVLAYGSDEDKKKILISRLKI